MTWMEVEAYLKRADCVVVPTGSTEQHGPMGLIGTDALCAEAIAVRAAETAGAVVAPVLAYAPAPFNTAFPGTISVSPALFEALAGEIVDGLLMQGFRRVFFLNGHGANVGILRETVAARPAARIRIRIRSWWDYEPVNTLRRELYGDWEGMHATPSEVAITQALHRIVEPPPEATAPPEKLTEAWIRDHAGDRHGSAADHRRRFPDGRVGSHSALASPEAGRALLAAAAAAVAADIREFCGTNAPRGH
jgi:creatinine amidohydrolase